MSQDNSSKKRALFFISKPQELLGAIEAREQFNISKSTLLYSCKEGIDKQTIEYLIKTSGNWHEVIFVKPKPYYGYFWVKLIKSLQKQYFNYVFTRAFSSSAYVIHNLNYHEHILLDDGSVTVVISKEFKDKGNLTKRFSLFKGLNKTGFKYKAISWLYSLFNISVEKPINAISFFTFINLPNVTQQRVYKNEMRWLNSLKDSGNFKHLDDSIFVVGTDFCGAKILTTKTYLKELLKIKTHYKNKALVYIPHPRENDEFLKTLQKHGFSIRKNTYNIELDFLLANEIPKHIVGTVSTALITLKLIYGKEIQVEYFRIEDDKLKEPHKSNFKNVYDYQKQYLNEVTY